MTEEEIKEINDAMTIFGTLVIEEHS